MGEIADALRRAHAERADRSAAQGSTTASRVPRDGSHAPRERIADVYSESARRHDAEQTPPERTREPASNQESSSSSAANSDTVSVRSAPPNVTEMSVEPVELTHETTESLAPQGVLIDEGNAVTDACLQLALRVRKALESQHARTLTVVSAMRGEGKTTVSCNLSLALASLGQSERIALVDLDLRRPSLQRVLELTAPQHGIEDVLAGAPLDGACVRIGAPALDVYPCLRGQAKAHEPLLQPTLERMVRDLRDRYEFVIFDSPPTLLVPDATIIMQHVECFVPVARQGRTRSRNFKKVLETLPRRRMLGAVLDGGALLSRRGYYDHYAPEPEASEIEEPESEKPDEDSIQLEPMDSTARRSDSQEKPDVR